jgi:hypothetical protein
MDARIDSDSILLGIYSCNRLDLSQLKQQIRQYILISG